MNVPEPIQVQMSVNTMTDHFRLRPATMKSSWLLMRLARMKLNTVKTRRYRRMMTMYHIPDIRSSFFMDSIV
jgi:hypothetical protein